MIRRYFLAFVLGGLAAGVQAQQRAVSEPEARAFFARLQSLSGDFDPAVADLYSDSAVIRSYRRYPHGLERGMELRGSQWKQLIVQAMPLAKAQNDRSDYRDLKIEMIGSLTKISAKRYSLRKCYWDDSYYVVLAKRADDIIEIVEEYIETQPQSNC